jgi:hypothetical protein
LKILPHCQRASNAHVSDQNATLDDVKKIPILLEKWTLLMRERERERVLHSKYDLRITMIVVSPHRQNWCAWPHCHYKFVNL